MVGGAKGRGVVEGGVEFEGGVTNRHVTRSRMASSGGKPTEAFSFLDLLLGGLRGE